MLRSSQIISNIKEPFVRIIELLAPRRLTMRGILIHQIGHSEIAGFFEHVVHFDHVGLYVGQNFPLRSATRQIDARVRIGNSRVRDELEDLGIEYVGWGERADFAKYILIFTAA